MKYIYLVVCFAGLTICIVRAQEIPAKNMKDLQQDNHIAYDDSRINTLENRLNANEARRDAAIQARNQQIQDLRDRVNNIYSWGAAATATLTVLQILGLIKQFGKERNDIKMKLLKGDD